MAGTLTIGTLSDGTNSTSATNCIQGSAKAWVNFNGTGTVAIRASYNVSSITDNGTGIYTVNFTTAMVDANYCIQVTSGSNSSALNAGARFETTAPTTTTAQVFTATAAGANADAAYVNVAIFR